MEQQVTEQPLTPEDVIRTFAPRVYTLARRILNSDADAEDVTQDVLLTVVQKLPSFRGDAAIGTWLHRVTVNAALAFRRKRARRAEHQVATSAPLDAFPDNAVHGDNDFRPWARTPDANLLNKETQRLIEEAISALPETYRDVFVLADVEGLSNAEIAELLDLQIPAVKSRLHRSRLMMRKALAPHFEEAAS
jgi:RNA polymerase sigma-70 factor (ECF subfamily)